MRFKIYFKDKSFVTQEGNEKFEEEVIKQMKRNPKKRLYTYGIEFSEVERVEIES